MASFGPNRIYVCGHNAYDNELALARHEGVQRLSLSSVMPVIDVITSYSIHYTKLYELAIPGSSVP